MQEKPDFNSDEQDVSIQPIDISREIRTSFLDYAMSVIVARALPDVRDGLKPVHRRIIYAMNDLGMTNDKPFKKSARIVGDVMAKYHPHGDQAIYDTMVRLAQEFSSRYMMVEGHGNFGSIDGDKAAAMRYTEARMSKIANEMIRDINKNTVDFGPNYDGEEDEPLVLPARIPNLLVNGSTGIAVGMATNIPPHNIGEIIDGLMLIMEQPEISVVDLMNQAIQGPDFPTGASILGKSGIKKAYETGNGAIYIRSKCEIEEKEGHSKKRIIVSEIPYQINKANMIEKIADLVRNKVIEGISDIRDESNREGIRIVIELKKDAISEVVLNQLYKYSSLQITYSINMLALVQGEPKVLPIKDMLQLYLDHQVEVITRKLRFELDRALDREHILQGLKIAGEHIDAIIALIRQSKTTEEALNGLMTRYLLSERQAKAVLDMRLQRLTGLEQDKIQLELQDVQASILDMQGKLGDRQQLLGVVKADLLEMKARYGDVRRTTFSNDSSLIEDEELIPVEDIIITLTSNGYVKRVTTDTYRTQNRGGRGIKGITTNEEDVVELLLAASTHTDVLFFSNLGKVYRLRGHQIPEYSRQGKGLPIVNLLQLDKEESIKSIISVDAYEDTHHLLFVTVNGIVKRVRIKEFENIRQNGKIAVTLKENDQLYAVKKTDGTEEVLIASSGGKVVRFDEEEVRCMGRSAAGVIGINLDEGEAVVGVTTSLDGSYILAITQKGYGKMSLREDYRLTKRGGKGVKTVNVTDKNGKLVGMRAVSGEEDLLVTTNKGIIIRISLTQVKIAGRNTQGVRLIRLDEEQEVASIAVTEGTQEE